MTKTFDQKVLQAVNLAPSKGAFEKLVNMHPMKQVVYASIIQLSVFGFMLLSFWSIGLIIN